MLSAPRMNLTSANYNVPEVEWRIRLVKEIIRATIHIINFHRIPNLMRTHAILSIGKILNYFTTKKGGINHNEHKSSFEWRILGLQKSSEIAVWEVL